MPVAKPKLSDLIKQAGDQVVKKPGKKATGNQLSDDELLKRFGATDVEKKSPDQSQEEIAQPGQDLQQPAQTDTKPLSNPGENSPLAPPVETPSTEAFSDYMAKKEGSVSFTNKTEPSADQLKKQGEFTDYLNNGLLKNNNPEVQQKLDFIKDQNKEKILAESQEEAQAKQREDELAKLDNGKGRIESFVANADQGLANIPADILQGGAVLMHPVNKLMSAITGTETIPIDETALYKAGEWYKEKSKEIFPNNPAFQDDLDTKVATAIGNLGGLVISGGATAEAKALAEFTKSSNTFVQGAKALATPPSLIGATQMGVSEFNQAKQAGASDDEAFNTFLKNAGAGGVLEALPVINFWKRLDQTTGGGVKDLLKKGAVQGIEESTTEVAQQVFSNVSAGQTYDTTRQWYDGMVESGGIGFGLGFLLGGMSKSLRKKQSEAKTPEEKADIQKAIDFIDEKANELPKTEENEIPVNKEQLASKRAEILASLPIDENGQPVIDEKAKQELADIQNQTTTMPVDEVKNEESTKTTEETTVKETEDPAVQEGQNLEEKLVDLPIKKEFEERKANLDESVRHKDVSSLENGDFVAVKSDNGTVYTGFVKSKGSKNIVIESAGGGMGGHDITISELKFKIDNVEGFYKPKQAENGETNATTDPGAKPEVIAPEQKVPDSEGNSVEADQEVVPPVVPPLESEGPNTDDPKKERQAYTKAKEDAALSDELKEGVKEEAKVYDPETQEAWDKEASDVFSQGTDVAREIALNPKSEISEPARVKLIKKLFTEYDRLATAAKKSGDKALEAGNRNKAIELLENRAIKGTELGKTLASYSDPNDNVSPTERLYNAKKPITDRRNEALQPFQEEIESVTQTLNKANEETIQEVLNHPRIEEIISRKISQHLKPGALPVKRKTIKDTVDFLESLKVSTKGKAFDATYAIPIHIYNGAISTIQAGIKAGHTVAKAIKAGIDYVNNNNKEEWDESGFSKQLEEKLGKFSDIDDKSSFNKPLWESYKAEAIEKINNSIGKISTKAEKAALQEFTDRLVANINKKEKGATKKPARDVLNEVLKNYDKYQEVFSETLGKENNEQVKSIFNLPFIKNGIDRYVIKNLPEKISEIIKLHYTKADQAKKSIVDKLVSEAGVDEPSAKALAKEIESSFDKLSTKAKQDAVKKAKATRAKGQSKPKQGVDQKLIELSNTGAINDEQVRQVYADQLGIKDITEQDAARIIDLGETIQEADIFAEETKKNFTEKNIKKHIELQGKKQKALNEIADILESKQPRDVWDTLSTIMQGNLLSPISLVTNVYSNALLQPLRFLSKLPSQAIDMVYSKATGKPRIIDLLASSKGYKTGFKDGAIEGYKQLKTGADVQELQKLEISRGFKPIRALMAGLDKSKSQTISERINNLVEGTFGMPAEAFFRALNFGDKPFQKANEMAKAYELASLKGLKGEEMQKFLLFPDAESAALIKTAGEEATFKSDTEVSKVASNFLLAIQKGIGKLPVVGGPLKVIVKSQTPFVKTPLNIIMETLDFAVPPLSLSKAIYYGKKGDRTKALEFMGKAMVGVMIQALADKLFEGGLLTGSPDDDKKERSLQYQANPPEGINLSGIQRLYSGGDPSIQKDDTWITYNKMGVLGVIFKMRATAGQNKKEEGAKFEGQFEEILHDTFSSIPSAASSALELSFLQGTNTLLTAVKDGKYDDWLANTFNAVSSIALPNTLASLNRATRRELPELRDEKISTRFLNVLKSKTFATGDLPSKIDLWGEPVRQTPDDRSALLYHLFDVTKARNISADRTSYDVFKLWQKTGDSDVIPSIPGKTQTYEIDGESAKVKLTPLQYERLQKYVGRSRKALVDAYLDGNEDGNEDKIASLKAIYKEGFESGKEQFFSEAIELNDKLNIIK
jgi:hypothetical protein